MNRLHALKRAFDAILKEAAANPTFAQRLNAALAGQTQTRPTQRSGRRKPGVLDPFSLYSDRGDALRQALASLDIEQLKDIVAEHGMDLPKLAMKWKRPERLIDLIVTTVRSRSRKGDAFRAPSPPDLFK